MPDQLDRQSRRLAGQVSRLLNRTITHGPHLSTWRDSVGRAVVGYRVGSSAPLGRPIPLTISRAKARIHLHYIETLDLDDAGELLTTVRSRYQLLADDHSTTFLTYEFVREPGNQYPPAHIHVHGNSDSLQRMLDDCGLQHRKPADLHLPVGGRLFRPSIEDIIEFCIVEKLATPRPGWQKALEERRREYHRQQAWVTARCFPDVAADALGSDGWQIAPPLDDSG